MLLNAANMSDTNVTSKRAAAAVYRTSSQCAALVIVPFSRKMTYLEVESCQLYFRLKKLL